MLAIIQSMIEKRQRKNCQWRRIFTGDDAKGQVRVYSGITQDMFFEGYDPSTREFNKSKVKKSLERERIHVTIKSFCGYSRKWAAYLAHTHESSPLVFSGLVDKAELIHHHYETMWIIPSGKIGVDELYGINTKYHNFAFIKPKDNSFDGDSDLSHLLVK
jgi:hypothetical protein